MSSTISRKYTVLQRMRRAAPGRCSAGDRSYVYHYKYIAQRTPNLVVVKAADTRYSEGHMALCKVHKKRRENLWKFYGLFQKKMLEISVLVVYNDTCVTAQTVPKGIRRKHTDGSDGNFTGVRQLRREKPRDADKPWRDKLICVEAEGCRRLTG